MFDKLTHAELLRTANEDFAFELSDEEKKTKKLTLAAFAEADLKFSDYLKANPGEVEKYADELAEIAAKKGVKVTGNTRANVNKEDIVVDQGSRASQPWLIKMTRENPLYEVGRYRFTETHPYVLVEANDVDKVIAEGGFRQATPSELTEYYG